jgi:CRP-like cAMP-binding protein
MSAVESRARADEAEYAAMGSASEHALDLLIRKLESTVTLSGETRQAIQDLPTKLRVLQSGQDIVRDGDQPAQCCLVLEGWLARYKLLDRGRRQILSFHVPGDVPDLQSLHLSVMDHSLCAVAPVTVAFIPHDSLRDLTARFPELGAALWRDTLIDAAIFRAWMVGMGRRSAPERIAHLFCEMFSKLEAVGLADGNRIAWPITQTDIADSLGLTPVHVNRVLQDLRARELITLAKRKLTIENRQELSELAEFSPIYLHMLPAKAA